MQAAFIVYAVFVALMLFLVIVVFSIVAITSLVKFIRRRFGRPETDKPPVFRP
jgi:hypothetical protein